MLVQAVLSVIVGACSLLVAWAALYVARRVDQAADRIEAADRRSRENRQIITGDPEHIDGILPRLDDIEREVQAGE